VWAVVVGFHIRREYFKPVAMRLALGARGLSPGSDFYIVRMNGQAIGFASSRLDTIASGFTFEDMIVLDVPAMDTVHRAIARTRLTVGKSLDMRTFEFVLQSGVGNFSVRGETRGDSALDLTVGAGGGAQKSTIAIDSAFVMDAALPMRIAASGQLMVGRELRVRVFDPSILASRDALVRILATEDVVVSDSAAVDPATQRWRSARSDTLRTWKIEQRMGSIAVTTWVDEDGKVVRADSPLGFTLEKTEYELATQEWRASQSSGKLAAGYGTLIEGTAISSNVDLGDVQRPELRVRLLNVDLAGFDLAGGRQRLHGDTLVIRRELLPAHAASYALPFNAQGNAQLASQLQAETLIQANDPRIIALARQIAGGETEPTRVSRKLNEWIYKELDKEITLSVPSALQVLEARKGDCNEHTVLYVALARALGLPARTAVGLVYVRGRFYYHAWPEVWLDRWVAVDPTLGQFPADASHLRFIIGNLAQQIELIRLIGRLRLEVIEGTAA
jgi:hypothetical protein